jgi:hypothetical protein
MFVSSLHLHGIILLDWLKNISHYTHQATFPNQEISNNYVALTRQG